MWNWLNRTPSEPRRAIPHKPLNYPADVFVRTELATYYITKGNMRIKVFSDRVLDSWCADVLEGSENSISGIKKSSSVLGFRNGTLVQSVADSKCYLISANKRRHITNPDVFDVYGFDTDTIVLVSQDEINLHDEGDVLA